jgi:hypothetical protein
MNDGFERVWKEGVIAILSYYPNTWLEGLRKTMKYIRQKLVSVKI